MKISYYHQYYHKNDCNYYNFTIIYRYAITVIYSIFGTTNLYSVCCNFSLDAREYFIIKLNKVNKSMDTYNCKRKKKLYTQNN